MNSCDSKLRSSKAPGFDSCLEHELRASSLDLVDRIRRRSKSSPPWKRLHVMASRVQLEGGNTLRDDSSVNFAGTNMWFGGDWTTRSCLEVEPSSRDSYDFEVEESSPDFEGSWKYSSSNMEKYHLVLASLVLRCLFKRAALCICGTPYQVLLCSRGFVWSESLSGVVLQSKSRTRATSSTLEESMLTELREKQPILTTFSQTEKT